MQIVHKYIQLFSLEYDERVNTLKLLIVVAFGIILIGLARRKVSSFGIRFTRSI